MRIRTYQEKDRQAVIELWRSEFPGTKHHHDPEISLDNKLAAGDGLLFVAVGGSERETVVGTVMAGYDGHRGWIYSLAVEQTQRGRGIGRALLKRAEEALQSRGCLKVNLQVLVSNAHVSEFYQKSGYAVEERLSFGKLLY